MVDLDRCFGVVLFERGGENHMSEIRVGAQKSKIPLKGVWFETKPLLVGDLHGPLLASCRAPRPHPTNVNRLLNGRVCVFRMFLFFL